MNAKKVKKNEAKMDLTDLKPNPNEEFDIKIDAKELEKVSNEKETDLDSSEESKPMEFKTLQISDVYAHVYNRVTNGGKVIKVLRQGAKVKEISRTFNWVEVEFEEDLRGFVRPQQLEEFKEEVDD